MENDCKLNVILDLDNTIINALDEKDRMKLTEEMSNKYHYIDYIPFFRIFARPHLETFLEYLFENYNVAVMTAAEKDYALFIIKNFILTKPDRKLKFIFFRQQVDLAREIYGGMKKLDIVYDFFKIPGFDRTNTILIDDLEIAIESNPMNSIRVKPFCVVDEKTRKVNYDEPYDDELLEVISQLESYRQSYNYKRCIN
jgi:hypothetical protein